MSASTNARLWPSGLPDFIYLQSYSEKPPKLTISSKEDGGNIKVNYLSHSKTRDIKGYFILSATQIELLDDYFISSATSCLDHGSHTMSFTHPRTSSSMEAILKSPRYAFTGKWWIANIELKVL